MILGGGGSEGQARYTIYYIQYTELILGGGGSEGQAGDDRTGTGGEVEVV